MIREDLQTSTVNANSRFHEKSRPKAQLDQVGTGRDALIGRSSCCLDTVGVFTARRRGETETEFGLCHINGSENEVSAFNFPVTNVQTRTKTRGAPPPPQHIRRTHLEWTRFVRCSLRAAVGSVAAVLRQDWRKGVSVSGVKKKQLVHEAKSAPRTNRSLPSYQWLSSNIYSGCGAVPLLNIIATIVKKWLNFKGSTEIAF